MIKYRVVPTDEPQAILEKAQGDKLLEKIGLKSMMRGAGFVVVAQPGRALPKARGRKFESSLQCVASHR